MPPEIQRFCTLHHARIVQPWAPVAGQRLRLLTVKRLHEANSGAGTSRPQCRLPEPPSARGTRLAEALSACADHMALALWRISVAVLTSVGAVKRFLKLNAREVISLFDDSIFYLPARLSRGFRTGRIAIGAAFRGCLGCLYP